jgi:hypothetical protein
VKDLTETKGTMMPATLYGFLWDKGGRTLEAAKAELHACKNPARIPHSCSVAIVFSILLLSEVMSHGQTSELYMLWSPNTIYPVGTTSVYQGGHLLRSWRHSTPYESALAVVEGTVRQGAVFAGFSGSEYTLSGAPTGTHYPAAPYVFDAASDGTWIYGWHVDSATLTRYDLNWKVQTNLFSLGPRYGYAYMGITYDLENNTVWLGALSTGSLPTAGYLYNYSLDGRLLGTLKLNDGSAIVTGLAYDPADGTLWAFNWGGNRLEQYSKTGRLLSAIDGISRIYGLEFAISRDVTPPLIAVSTDRQLLWPPNGAMVPVTVRGRITDNERGGSGVNPNTAAYAVLDGYRELEPKGPIHLQSDGSYAFVILLQASRHPGDPEGREYMITVTAQDRSGNTGAGVTSVIVPPNRRPGSSGGSRPYLY